MLYELMFLLDYLKRFPYDLDYTELRNRWGAYLNAVDMSGCIKTDEKNVPNDALWDAIWASLKKSFEKKEEE